MLKLLVSESSKPQPRLPSPCIAHRNGTIAVSLYLGFLRQTPQIIIAPFRRRDNAMLHFGKPQTGSFVTGSFRQALATRSSSSRQTFVSTVFVFAIARQTLAKRLSITTRLECTCLGFPEHCEPRVQWKIASNLRFRTDFHATKPCLLREFWRFGPWLVFDGCRQAFPGVNPPPARVNFWGESSGE